MTDAAPNRFSFAKLVTFMALAFLVGLGLCGLDFVLGANGIGGPREEFSVGPLDSVSLIVMALSAAGLILSLIARAIVAVARSFDKKVSQPTSQFGEQEDTKVDKRD